MSGVDVPLVHKFVMYGVTRLPLHNVTLCLLVRQGDGRNLTAKKNDPIEKKKKKKIDEPFYQRSL